MTLVTEHIAFLVMTSSHREWDMYKKLLVISDDGSLRAYVYIYNIYYYHFLYVSYVCI